MPLLEILLIALGLAMDATAVSLGVGTTVYASKLRSRVRLAFHFGLFQFLMPVIGWLGGSIFSAYIQEFDHWVVFGLLGIVGGKMIYEGVCGEGERPSRDPSKGRTMVMLSLATSLDAMAIGVSLALLKVDVWYPAAVIGVVTALLSYFGITLGRKLGERFGKRMEIVGGAVLILIGARILLQHQWGIG
ncbi:MAG: manganese efflux pump [Spirochaetes bacterium]|nr:manganese efflux pump [Spirochaetota bacterium]